MTKLLARFEADQSAANAKRVMAYLAKHPMCECMLTAHERGPAAGA